MEETILLVKDDNYFYQSFVFSHVALANYCWRDFFLTFELRSTFYYQYEM